MYHFESCSVSDCTAVPQVGFKHHKDYVGYVWAKQEEADFHRQEHQVNPLCALVSLNILPQFTDILLALFQVTFPEEELPKGSGDFILGYYSNNMSTIVGVTEPFQVILNLTLHS